MSAWAISPFESVGPVRLGATPGEVHAAVEGSFRAFEKGPDLVEANDSAGFHVYYDSDEKLAFIELFAPCKVAYAGLDLLHPTPSDTVSELEKLGLVCRDDGEGGLWFEEQGFALYSPAQQVEAVSVFRRGYDTGA